jgi:hypothetical protein
MPRVAVAGAILGAAVLLAGGTAGCGSTAAQQASGSATASPVASPVSAIASPVSGLPPCQTATATGCDRSKLPTNPRASSACVGKGPGTITASPVGLGDIAYVQPMGLMIGAHVTPIDHGYFYVKGALATPPRETPIYSPLDGNVSVVTRTVRASATAGGATTYDDYAITIEATCTFRVRFSNMLRFSGGLEAAIGPLAANETKTPNYHVRAGELIGATGLPTAYGIDVWVENDDLTLTGFIDPAQYTAGEAWKTHMADLFQYTREPIKSELLALDERDATPRWGRIGYDIDGKLVGNWFRVGTGGYAGLTNMREGYWVGHLSLVYDGNDPGQIIVSVGDYQATPMQFAVIGNEPDPASVDPTTGLIKYELGQIEWFSADTGMTWDHQAYMPHVRTRAGADVIGTILLQLVGPRSLKVEIFPGKTAGQVSGFDAGALLYQR